MTLRTFFETAGSAPVSSASARELSPLPTFREFLFALFTLYLADAQGLGPFHDWHIACHSGILEIHFTYNRKDSSR